MLMRRRPAPLVEAYFEPPATGQPARTRDSRPYSGWIRDDSLVDLGVEEVELRAKLERGHAFFKRLVRLISSIFVCPGPLRLTFVSVAVPYSSVPQIYTISAPPFDKGSDSNVHREWAR